MPTEIKDRVKDFIPEEVVDKIATENDAKTVEELKTFLKDRSHPLVQTWKAEIVEAPEVTPVEGEGEILPEMPVASIPTLPVTTGGYKIILKDAKIYAKKMIIRPLKGGKKVATKKE